VPEQLNRYFTYYFATMDSFDIDNIVLDIVLLIVLGAVETVIVQAQEQRGSRDLFNSMGVIDCCRGYFTMIDVFLGFKTLLTPIQPATRELRCLLALVLW
jgi:hypothetical protein